MTDGQQVPTGVKIISVLIYIGAVSAILLGIFLLFGAGIIGSIADQIPILGLFGSGLFVISGIILIGLGVLYFFIGRGLWNARPWARIVTMIFAGLGILAGVISMIQGNITDNVFNLALSLVIGGYLMFNTKVKEAFV